MWYVTLRHHRQIWKVRFLEKPNSPHIHIFRDRTSFSCFQYTENREFFVYFSVFSQELVFHSRPSSRLGQLLSDYDHDVFEVYYDDFALTIWSSQTSLNLAQFIFLDGNVVRDTRYGARSRGHSSPNTLAFSAYESSRPYSRLFPGLQFSPPVQAPGIRNYTLVQWGAPYLRRNCTKETYSEDLISKVSSSLYLHPYIFILISSHII